MRSTPGHNVKTQQQPGLPLTLNNTVSFKSPLTVKIATALAVCCSARCTPGMGVILWGASPLYVNPVTVMMTGT
jgi:hypothetical protein